jgi:hypothetical protein
MIGFTLYALLDAASEYRVGSVSLRRRRQGRSVTVEPISTFMQAAELEA